MLQFFSSTDTYVILGTIITLVLVWYVFKKQIYSILDKNIVEISNRFGEAQKLKDDANDAVYKMEIDIQKTQEHLNKVVAEVKHELQSHRKLTLEKVDQSLQNHLKFITKQYKEVEQDKLVSFLHHIEKHTYEKYIQDSQLEENNKVHDNFIENFLKSVIDSSSKTTQN